MPEHQFPELGEYRARLKEIGARWIHLESAAGELSGITAEKDFDSEEGALAFREHLIFGHDAECCVRSITVERHR